MRLREDKVGILIEIFIIKKLLLHLLLLFSRPVVSYSLRPHRLQNARPPCPSPSPGAYPSSCSLHQWCHPAISSSDTLFSFCPQSFPVSETFPRSHLFTLDDQNTGASASTSVLPVNIQGWAPLRWTGLISLLLFTDFKFSFLNYNSDKCDIWGFSVNATEFPYRHKFNA